MKKGNVLLFITAVIWGMAFVAQSVAMDNIGPWTFTCLRSYIAGITLTILMPFFHAEKKKDSYLWKGGLACGICLCISSILQQFGVKFTTVGKAGFITALYVVIVPILSMFFGKKISKKMVCCVALSVMGLYFLCMKETLTITKGDMFVLFCALGFAVHILVVDYFSKKTDGVSMSCIQFYVVGILCTIPMLVIEKPSLDSIALALVPILYAGVLSSGAGYTLQIVGQKDTDPTVASLLMSLESVFAAIGGFLLLHQTMTTKEVIGCMLTFMAIILSQIPIENWIKKEHR